MATTAGTTPTEVRVEIDTELADSDVNDILDRVERDINREYGSGTTEFDDTQHRIDFEAVVAAYRIGTGRDPRMERERVGDVTLTYDASQVRALRTRVVQLDPGDAFGRAGALRDTERHVTSTGDG